MATLRPVFPRLPLPRAVAPLLTVLAMTLAALPAAAASAAEPGVNLTNPTPQQVAVVKSLGVHWVRVFATWPDLEPQPGVFASNWLNYYEKLFHSLPPSTKVIVDLVDTPNWETGSSDEHRPPANPSDYAAFAASLASRWGSHVSAFEIWNEENTSAWWAGTPDPSAYAALLKATYPAVKAAHPNTTVLLGGLAGNDYQFLEGVYQAGARGYFDAVAVHTDTACDVLSPYDFLRGPDDRMIADSFLAYREIHAVMLANADPKPVWMTELSWRTTDAICPEGAFAGQKPEGVTDARQALYLSQAYHCLAQNPYVPVALWFPLQDEGAVLSGLLNASGTRKPSYVAMRSHARHGDTVKGSCGVFTGPNIHVSSPANHVSYAGPLPILVSAHSTQGVFRIRLEIDGKLIRNYDGPSFPSTLHGALDWQGAKHIPYGRHLLTFLAYDKERNVSRRSLVIFHRPPPRHHRRHGPGTHPAHGSRR